MKFFVLLFGIILSLNAYSAEQELSFRLKSDGQPSFGIQYAYDIDAAFAFTYATTITDKSLSTLPNVIVFNVINIITDEPMADWSVINKADLKAGSLGISSKPAITNILPNLKDAKFVFGSNNQQGGIDILFSIRVGPLCLSYPDHFLDLSNPSKPACTVTVQDLPDWDREFKEL